MQITITLKAAAKGFVAVGALVVGFSVADGAQAQSLVGGLFNRLFGVEEEGPAINYSERAPLVIPPKRELRKPGPPMAEAGQDPAWPKDPDVAKKRRKAGLAAGPGEGRDELAPGDLAVTGGGLDKRTSWEIEQQVKHSSNPVSPTVLRRKGSFGAPKVPLAPGTEPPRQSLIDPPRGLRVPAGSAPVDGSVPLPSEAQEDANRSIFSRLNPFD